MPASDASIKLGLVDHPLVLGLSLLGGFAEKRVNQIHDLDIVRIAPSLRARSRTSSRNCFMPPIWLAVAMIESACLAAKSRPRGEACRPCT